MIPSDELVLDKRTREDLRRQIGRLAASYTPEWRFDTETPDAGSTLAIIFSNQMADNIARLNRLPGKYHTEFANMLGVSLLPASPATGIVVASLAGDTIPGVALSHGTRLLGQGNDSEPVVFETINDLYVTASRLTDVVAISPRQGKIIPILGGPAGAQLYAPAETEPEPQEKSVQDDGAVPPFSLFDFEDEGIEKNTLMLYHKSIFDAEEGMSIYLRPYDGEGRPMARLLADKELYRFTRNGEDGPVPFDSVTADGDVLVLTQQKRSRPVKLDTDELFVVCVERLKPVTDDILISDLRISSVCGERPPDFVLHNDDELDAASFKPFGDFASIYDECFIGADKLFSQQGADIRIRFNLTSEEKLATFTPQQEAAELKVIKRKPTSVLFDTVTTSPMRVQLEYYNGLGWKRLVTKNDCATLFDGTNGGQSVISFVCPGDWQSTNGGGMNGRMLRLRILQADNCYLQPCVHTMPVISQMKLSCAYDGEWKQPHRLCSITGTRKKDLTASLLAGKAFPAFSPLPYGCDALYLGLDAKPQGSPISMLFDAAESVLPDDTPLTFEYSTLSGFKPLKVVDGTRSLTRSGTVIFMPPNDFAAMEVEGVSRFWLRLTDTAEIAGKPARFRPVISRLLMNAVDISNQQTMPRESFFIDQTAPNMTFPLAAESIFKARVYVSELPKHSPSAMEQMARQMPEQVLMTRDALGIITSFFVLWEEVENFDNSAPNDRHYIIDRMNNTISFGDGVHVAIPQAQRGVAFTVEAVCCNGGAGNLPTGSVNAMFDNALYIGEVTNPLATFGGSDLETIASAQQRGASIVCGRNRLVSALDYVREVYAFSDAIEKVRCVAGIDIWGRQAPGTITLAVMSRDYADGAYSFTGLHDGLKARLLSRCEATITEDNLCLCEPSYVRVSVDVWVQVESAAHAFDAQNLIIDSITRFIDPLSKDGAVGWDMGVLPTDSQIKQLLHSLRFRGYITKFIITARYVDENGPHEADLDAMAPNPFAIAVNGNHHVYLELENH